MNEREVEWLTAGETDASGQTRDGPPPEGGPPTRPTQSVVYSIRLTPEQTEQIQRIADNAGVPAIGIVRGWVLQGLAAGWTGHPERPGLG